MFIGHAAVALAAKPLLPRVNLALPLAAAFWVDMVWPVFLLFGIEQVKIDPGNTAFTPLDFAIGFGLWNSVPATMLVECAMFAAGIWIYVRAAPARDRTGTWAFWGLIGFLAIAYLGNAFGPPPPHVSAIAIAGIAGGVLFTAWAWWADRHRGRKT